MKSQELGNIEVVDGDYANLDKTLMTKVVPWVPYLWSYVTRITSNNVTHYQFDQFSTTPAYAMISVKA